MAVITPTRVDSYYATTITWTNITTADTGAAVQLDEHEDVKAVQVTSGGAGTAQLRASNDGTNFANVGSALAVGITAVTMPSKYINIGTVATATVTVILHVQRRAKRN
jgi:hypothetical protein